MNYRLPFYEIMYIEKEIVIIYKYIDQNKYNVLRVEYFCSNVEYFCSNVKYFYI